MPNLRKLRVYPDPILHEVSKPVFDFHDKSLYTLMEDMFVTMEAAEGIGLAAVQVGELRRVIVIQTSDHGVLALINPKIVESAGLQELEEGCLSVPGVYENRVRMAHIQVSFDTYEGDHSIRWFDELEAFCIQHEIDHLDGKVFIDLPKFSPLKKKRYRDKIAKTVRKNKKDPIKQRLY